MTNYIYNPRVSTEPLTSYKSLFLSAVPQELQKAFRSSPEALRQWCIRSITIDEANNPLSYPIEPLGVWRTRRADRHSLGIFFVSLARTMAGLPALMVSRVRYSTTRARLGTM